MNEILSAWYLDLTTMFIGFLGIGISYGFEKLFKWKHQKYGTTPRSRFDDPSVYRITIYFLIGLIIYIIVEPIFKFFF
ncbi:hypothetical protein D3C74_140790 [compost metagenome]